MGVVAFEIVPGKKRVFCSQNIFLLFGLSNLWTFLLTLIPVLVNIPPNNYYSQENGWLDVLSYMAFFLFINFFSLLGIQEMMSFD